MNKIDQKLQARDLRDEILIAGVAQGKSITQISKELGISRNTTYLVLDSPWGQKRLSEVVTDIRQAVNLKLPKLTILALTKLEAVLNGEVSNESAKTYVAASNVVLDLTTKLSELSLKEGRTQTLDDVVINN